MTGKLQHGNLEAITFLSTPADIGVESLLQTDFE